MRTPWPSPRLLRRSSVPASGAGNYRHNAYAPQIAAMNDAKAAHEFQRPMRCNSPTIVSMLSGTLITDALSQRPAAARAATTPMIPAILSNVLGRHLRRRRRCVLHKSFSMPRRIDEDEGWHRKAKRSPRDASSASRFSARSTVQHRDKRHSPARYKFATTRELLPAFLNFPACPRTKKSCETS